MWRFKVFRAIDSTLLILQRTSTLSLYYALTSWHNEFLCGNQLNNIILLTNGIDLGKMRFNLNNILQILDKLLE